MNTLASKRRSYIQAAFGNMDRLNHVTDVLFERGMITEEEMESIQCIRGTHDKARVLIDCARRKGDATNNMLMTTWENYPCGKTVRAGSSAATDDHGMSPGDILNILDALTRDDIDKLKFYMKAMPVPGGREHVGDADLDGVTDRTQIADAIMMRYEKENIRGALTSLLRRIHRNDLSNMIRDSGRDHNSSRERLKFVGYRKVVDVNKSAVTEEVLNILLDLGGEQFKRFIWTARLPSSTSERIKTAADLSKALEEHVEHDMLMYVETFYETLREIRENDSAEKLNVYILGLST